MKQILIIADDLTGAAEIGGIALGHGLSATIQCGQFQNTDSDAVAIDTDSRHSSDAAAAERIRKILGPIDSSKFDLIYKKTDSMMRGPVAAELFAALNSFGLKRAMFVPQNPSRGRIIENGKYFIDGVPLDQSPIAVDPKHPPTTSDVCQILDPAKQLNIQCVSPNQTTPLQGIIIGAAASVLEIQHWAAQRIAGTLFAGGADFFTAVLRSLGPSPIVPEPFVPNSRGAVVIFGSASTPSREFVEKLANVGHVICGPDQSVQQILAEYQSSGHVFVAARQAVASDRAEQIRKSMADLIAAILSKAEIKTLFIEGGASASAIIQRMGWITLPVKSQIATGVVTLTPADRPNLVLVLKPGTYPWPPDMLPTSIFKSSRF